MKSDVRVLHWVVSRIARGLGVASAFVRAQQLSHGTALSGACHGPNVAGRKPLSATAWTSPACHAVKLPRDLGFSRPRA